MTLLTEMLQVRVLESTDKSACTSRGLPNYWCAGNFLAKSGMGTDLVAINRLLPAESRAI
jgi:hypothetical protein